MVTVSVEEKWAEVDAIVERIEKRKENGEVAIETPLEEYVDFQFNPNSHTRKS